MQKNIPLAIRPEFDALVISELDVIIEEVTGLERGKLTRETSFVDDLNIDSLSMVEMAVQTEDKFGVKIPDEDLSTLRTVGKVQEYVAEIVTENPQAAQFVAERCLSEDAAAIIKRAVGAP